MENLKKVFPSFFFPSSLFVRVAAAAVSVSSSARQVFSSSLTPLTSSSPICCWPACGKMLQISFKKCEYYFWKSMKGIPRIPCSAFVSVVRAVHTWNHRSAWWAGLAKRVLTPPPLSLGPRRQVVFKWTCKIPLSPYWNRRAKFLVICADGNSPYKRNAELYSVSQSALNISHALRWNITFLLAFSGAKLCDGIDSYD